MRSLMVLVASALILSLFAINAAIPNAYGASVGAPTATLVSSSTVSTDHMMVQLSFPDSAYPGQSITIHATTTAKLSGTIVSFSMGVFALIDGQLMKIASQTIVANGHVAVGEEWRSSLVVHVPADAQSGLLTGTITEVWQQAPNYSSSYYATPYYNMPYRLTARLSNGVVSLQTPTGGTIVVNPQVALAPLPNEVVALRTSSGGAIVLNPRVALAPLALYNVPYYTENLGITNHSPNYPPSRPPTQVTSQQTFLLTHVLGCGCDP